MTDTVHLLNNNLTLYECLESPIIVHVNNLSLIQSEDIVSECHLTFQISLELYQRIDTNALFNLSLKFRTPLSNGDFHPDLPIQLKTTLHPDLLPHLLEHAQTAEEASAYLLTLSQQQAEQASPNPSEDSSAESIQAPETLLNPLLKTENWFCLSAKQVQETGETGYTTFWHYVNPATINQPGASKERIGEDLTHFVKDWVAASLTDVTQDIANELFKGVTGLFDGFETWLENGFAKDKGSTHSRNNDNSILKTVITFFTNDDWTFTKLQGQTALRMAFQGNNGQWNCYAQARETQAQFVFYSIYPIPVPEDQRLAMAEFITRANYGLLIGNFELDFTDGEVRYKTSIDVEGGILTAGLLKQLVYANVMIMDHYLPGIQAVLEGTMSPEAAISQIEGQTSIATTTDQEEPSS
jgi:hypothetical protein